MHQVSPHEGQLKGCELRIRPFFHQVPIKVSPAYHVVALKSIAKSPCRPGNLVFEDRSLANRDPEPPRSGEYLLQEALLDFSNS